MFAQTMVKAMPESLVRWAIQREAQARQTLHHVALRRAQARAFKTFAQQNQAWAASLFDEFFLNHAAAPLLQRRLRPGDGPTAAELAAAWASQLAANTVNPRTIAEAVVVAARFLALLDQELGCYHGEGSAGGPDTAPRCPKEPAYAAEATGPLAEALRDPSNFEDDWLVLADAVVRESERRYCLERALYINPQSTYARQLLTTCR